MINNKMPVSIVRQYYNLVTAGYPCCLVYSVTHGYQIRFGAKGLDIGESMLPCECLICASPYDIHYNFQEGGTLLDYSNTVSDLTRLFIRGQLAHMDLMKLPVHPMLNLMASQARIVSSYLSWSKECGFHVSNRDRRRCQVQTVRTSLFDDVAHLQASLIGFLVQDLGEAHFLIEY
jgi:hypothetical protein